MCVVRPPRVFPGARCPFFSRAPRCPQPRYCADIMTVSRHDRITYSIGLGIPFILSGYYLGNFLMFSHKAKKYIEKIQKGSGIILIITGILILSSKLQSIGFYLLELFPFLGKLG